MIPQRATYEILAKKYVYVIEEPKAGSGDEHAEHKDDKHAEKSAAAHSEKTTTVHGEKAVAHGEKKNYKHGIAKQREIAIKSELDDIYIIKSGIGPNDKIVLEGVQQVRDGMDVEYEYLDPEAALKDLKHHAE
ncbi:MAG: hypothetical protein QM811_31710 [Pirellulales bacterium]